jgi:hypothetical protein
MSPFFNLSVVETQSLEFLKKQTLLIIRHFDHHFKQILGEGFPEELLQDLEKVALGRAADKTEQPGDGAVSLELLVEVGHGVLSG